MGGKERATLSQAEKQRLKDEKSAAKAAGQAEERTKRAEQHTQLKHTPDWLKDARDKFRDLIHRLEQDGTYGDTVVARCRFHEQELARLVQQLETEKISTDEVEGAAFKENLLEYLLEAPCGPAEIAERLGDTSADEDETLYVIESRPPPGPDAQPPTAQRAKEDVMKDLEDAANLPECDRALAAAEELLERDQSLDAAVDRARATRNRLLVESAPFGGPPPERQRRQGGRGGRGRGSGSTDNWTGRLIAQQAAPPVAVEQPAGGRLHFGKRRR
jgi:hypothetical protein